MKVDLNKIKRTIRDSGIVLSLHAYEEAFAEHISVDEIEVKNEQMYALS